MTGSQGTGRTASRRAVVAAAGAAGLTAALAACGSDSDGGGGSAQSQADSSAPAKSGSGGGGGKGAEGGADGAVLGKTSQVPEGGGMVFPEQKVVVTQPAKGDFKAFSATCTHQGCQVKEVTGGTINCPCHGSKFAIADGSVKHGPATQPLPGAKITVAGDSIKLG